MNATSPSLVQLYDGAIVRLDCRWHHNPVFIADLCGTHYDVAGYTYDLDGQPLNALTPPIVEVLKPS